MYTIKFNGVTSESDIPPSPMTGPDYKELANNQLFYCLDERTGLIETFNISPVEGVASKYIPPTKTTKAEYHAFVQETFAGMAALIKKKNTDYCGKTDDPFANFRRAEAVGVDPLQGLAVRFLDKVARIESFFQSGKLENESFEDAWLDVIGYACLALGMLKEKGNAK